MKHMFWFVSVAVVASVCTINTARALPPGEAATYTLTKALTHEQDPPVPDSTYDVLSYEFWVTPFVGQDSIFGVAKLTCQALIEGMTEMNVDLNDTIHVQSVVDGGYELTRNQADDKLFIELGRSVSQGETFVVTITYSGYPPSFGRSLLFGEQSGYPIVHTISEPFYARNWIPVHESLLDRATVTMHLTVPKPMIAVGNGVLAGTVDNGATQTFTWEHNYPIQPYCIGFAAAAYKVFETEYVSTAGDTFPIQYYYLPGDSAWVAQNWVPRIAHAMPCLEGWFGAFPFRLEKYALVTVPSGNAAMEHSTCSFHPFHDIKWVEHELAHQWFGDYVTLGTWNDVWLNEGFATWAQAIAAGCENPSDYFAKMTQFNNTGDQCFTGSVYGSGFTIVKYHGGAWVVHMLRHELGEEKFWQLIAAYLATYGWGGATTQDLEDLCTSIAGTDMSWFFDQRVYRTCKPVYRVSYEEIGLDSATITVEQTQTVGLFYATIPFSFYLNGDPEPQLVELWNDEWVETYGLSGIGQVDSIIVDPQDWLLEVHGRVIETGVAESPILSSFKMSLHPMPMRDRCTVLYDLPDRGDPVTLAVYNVSGRLIKTLLDGMQSTGQRMVLWDGTSDDQGWVSSGVYFIRCTSGKQTKTQRIVLIR